MDSSNTSKITVLDKSLKIVAISSFPFLGLSVVLCYLLYKFRNSRKGLYVIYIMSGLAIILLFNDLYGRFSRSLAELILTHFNAYFNVPVRKLLEIVFKLHLILLGSAGVICLPASLFMHLSYKRSSKDITREDTSDTIKWELKTRFNLLLNCPFAFIGVDKHTGDNVFLDAGKRSGHVLISGASGTGKTYRTLIPLMYSDIMNGHSVFYFDAKGDHFYKEFYGFVKKAGREKDFLFFSLDRPEESCTYNPLKHGNSTQIKAKLMYLFDWSEVFYREECEKSLKYFIDALIKNNETTTLEKLLTLAESEQNDKNVNLQTKLSNLVNTSFGDLISKENSDINFIKAQKENQIIYIQLNKMSYLEETMKLGKLFLLDLMFAANNHQMNYDYQGKYVGIYIDEFGDFVFPGFDTYLKQARSSGHVLHLAHQSLSDLDAVSTHFKNSIITNTKTKIILRQECDVEIFSALPGTFISNAETSRTKDGHITGDGTTTQDNKYHINPNFIRTLKTGEAVILTKDPFEMFFVDLPIPVRTEPRNLPAKTKENDPFVTECTPEMESEKGAYNEIKF